MEFPTTLIEFQAMFPDEAACLGYLRSVRWPEGFVCPGCGHRQSCWLEGRQLEQCLACRRQTSVTAGTIFHKTRIPLRIWFLAIFFIGRHKSGISALQLQRDTGLRRYETAWHLLHKIRAALRPRSGWALRGRVEADESYVGGHHPGCHGRGQPRKGIVMVAALNRGTSAGSARLAVIPDITQKTLGAFLEDAIDPAHAVLHTDGYPSYKHLPTRGIRHQAHVDEKPADRVHTLPWAHTIFSNLKGWIRGTFHGVSVKHLPKYLDEFAYRFNRRGRDGELFYFVTRRLVTMEPVTYAQIALAEQTG